MNYGGGVPTEVPIVTGQAEEWPQFAPRGGHWKLCNSRNLSLYGAHLTPSNLSPQVCHRSLSKLTFGQIEGERDLRKTAKHFG